MALSGGPQRVRFVMLCGFFALAALFNAALVIRNGSEHRTRLTVERRLQDQVESILTEAAEKREQASRLLSRAERLIADTDESKTPLPNEPENASP